MTALSRQVRILLLFVMAAALLGVVGLVTAQSADRITSVSIDTNIRSGPGTEWRVLGTAQRGTTVRLDGQAYNGSWVRGITSRGVVGWMFTDNMAISRSDAQGLRVIFVEEPFNLSAPAQQGAVGGGSGVPFTALTRVNIRSGPSTDFDVVGGLDNGESFTVDGRSADSAWVRGINGEGTVGWVFWNFVRGNFNSLPVVTADTPFGLGAPSTPVETVVDEPPTTDDNIPVDNTAPVAGFNLGGHVQNMNDFTFGWMRVAGMSWVKKQVRWVPGQDPGGVAGIINTAHANGFRILLGIVGDGARVNDPGYFEAYAAYVGGVAALGADAIEVWNEPNIDREWAAGSIDPGRYTQMLAMSYNAIKGANPNTLVISGAPAPTGFFGGCSGAGCDDRPFLQGMAAAGAANYMDCVGAHYNEGIVPPNWTSGDPRGNSGFYTRYYGPMVDVYYGAFGGRRPVCFTELGYLTPEGYGPLPPGFQWAQDTSLGEQVAWIDQVVGLAARSGRVRLLIVWNVDFTNYGGDPMAGYALIRPGGDCPACRALGS